MNRQIAEVYEGKLNADSLRFGIVCSRFNELFVSNLLDGVCSGDSPIVEFRGLARTVRHVDVGTIWDLVQRVPHISEFVGFGTE